METSECGFMGSTFWGLQNVVGKILDWFLTNTSLTHRASSAAQWFNIKQEKCWVRVGKMTGRFMDGRHLGAMKQLPGNPCLKCVRLIRLDMHIFCHQRSKVRICLLDFFIALLKFMWTLVDLQYGVLPQCTAWACSTCTSMHSSVSLWERMKEIL